MVLWCGMRICGVHTTRTKGMRRVDATCFRINNHTRVRLDRVLARNVCAFIYENGNTAHAPLTILRRVALVYIWKGCGWIYSARTHAFETSKGFFFLFHIRIVRKFEFIQIL